jgi:hypothetical protein
MRFVESIAYDVIERMPSFWLYDSIGSIENWGCSIRVRS